MYNIYDTFSCFHNYVSKNALLCILYNIFIMFFSCFHNYVSKKCIARHVLFSHFWSFLSIYYILTSLQSKE